VVTALQAGTEQGAVTCRQAIAGGELVFGIGGALGEFVSHQENMPQRTIWEHSFVSMPETHMS
jgi:hypothetical protein